jgi:hypothetical protein
MLVKKAQAIETVKRFAIKALPFGYFVFSNVSCKYIREKTGLEPPFETIWPNPHLWRFPAHHLKPGKVEKLFLEMSFSYL